MRYRDNVMNIRVGLYVLLLLVFVASLLPSAALAQEAAEPVCIQCDAQLPEKYSQPV